MAFSHILFGVFLLAISQPVHGSLCAFGDSSGCDSHDPFENFCCDLTHSTDCSHGSQNWPVECENGCDNETGLCQPSNPSCGYYDPYGCDTVARGESLCCDSSHTVRCSMGTQDFPVPCLTGCNSVTGRCDDDPVYSVIGYVFLGLCIATTFCCAALVIGAVIAAKRKKNVFAGILLILLGVCSLWCFGIFGILLIIGGILLIVKARHVGLRSMTHAPVVVVPTAVVSQQPQVVPVQGMAVQQQGMNPMMNLGMNQQPMYPNQGQPQFPHQGVMIPQPYSNQGQLQHPQQVMEVATQQVPFGAKPSMPNQGAGMVYVI